MPVTLAQWVAQEPVASLLLLVTAGLIFGARLQRGRRTSSRFWPWLSNLIQSLAVSLLFIGLACVFYLLLSSNSSIFSTLHGSFTTGGSLARTSWLDWQARYGAPFVQRPPFVTQYVSRAVLEPIPSEDPAQPVLYRTATIEQPVEQNTLTGFDGRVRLQVVDPQHAGDAFNAFTLSASYGYQVTNPMDVETRAEFRFPIWMANLYRDVKVEMDGHPVVSWHVEPSAIVWESRMRPGQSTAVLVEFVVTGMESFLFEVPSPREIKDFSLSVTLDSDYCCLVNEPEGAIQFEGGRVGDLRTVAWNVDSAIMAPRMGIILLQGWPYAPSQALITLLPYAARALVLFLCMAALTLLITAIPVDLRRLALLACLFAVPFLLLMAGAFPAPASIAPANWDLVQTRLLPLLALFSIGIGYLVLRGLPLRPLVLVLLLMALFLCVYPFTGFVQDPKRRNALENIVQAGMIFYVFGLSLYLRVRGSRAGSQPES